MLFTPEERRALLALTALLLLGQVVSFWEEQKRSRPDRELSKWIERLARARGDSLGIGGGDLAGVNLQGCVSLPLGLTAPAGPPPSREIRQVRAESLDSVPPGILEGGRVRINEASASDLEGLPGIGPSLAGKILAERERSGPFRKPEDLLRVSGIGPKTLSRFRDRIDCSAPQKAIPREAPPQESVPQNADSS